MKARATLQPDAKRAKYFGGQPKKSKVWKARKDASDPASAEVTYIRVPISSLGEDRDGDHFNEAGLKSMADQLDTGLVPLYFDHGRAPGDWSGSYSVRDMVGGWVKGEVDAETLFGTAMLEPGNADGEALARKISAGLPVGFSVGFIPHELTNILDEKNQPTYKYEFGMVDLLEVSAVGIPSNPDAVARSAALLLAKGLRARGVTIPNTSADDGDVVGQLVRLLQEEATMKTGTTPTDPAPDATKGAAPTDLKTVTDLVTAKFADLEAKLPTMIDAAIKTAIAPLLAKADKPADDADDPKKPKPKPDADKPDDTDDGKSADPAAAKRPEPRAIATLAAATPTDDQKSATDKPTEPGLVVGPNLKHRKD